MEHEITTPDGRTLAVQDLGDPAGKPLLLHMGTPNSRHLYPPIVADAAARGLRLVCWDRPGYGGSTPQPERTIADVAADVRTICAALGFERIGTWGISGGGPHVLACAALLPDLVAAAASLASPAPYPADGIGDYFAGMGEDNVEDVQLIISDEAAAVEKHKREWAEMREVTGSDIAAAMASLLTPVDAAVLTGDLAEYLAFTMRDGLAPGPEGYWADSLAMVRPWGFELSDIAVPVLLLHGQHDQFVPQSHGAWLAGQIPGVDARLLDDDGHLTLLQKHVGDVHAWLAAHL
ncbi:alpha/beta fold hydrolase [Trebonia kvetii]|uniref:Alpha/beta fold hydrolase n=1 Tax=Trebonia kvetii TaxID=2480626 RepID=A0A6P2C0C3_9ACTN|nr:alpha/beta fold hydrolase [Trebonia kvetii]TVZ04822.1 alpha/beta fold hydrolase [Trebonia kvetii]